MNEATAFRNGAAFALGERLALQAGDALLCIDVQRDFLPGGALAVSDGARVIEPLNACMAAFAAKRLPVFLSRDWHPLDHCSFAASGGPWPAHCVQDHAGAQWPDALQIPADARIVSKGADRAAEAYSAFAGTGLAAQLRELRIRRLFVGGLATDYCVRASVLDALAEGFDVVVLADAIAAVEVQSGDGERALADMLARGAMLAETRWPHLGERSSHVQVARPVC